MAKSRVTGGRETAAAMRQLAGLVAGPANSASKHALEPTLGAAAENLKADGSIRSGLLLRSLLIKRQRSPKTKPIYRVGPDAASDARRYAHLVEFGTLPHLVGGRFAGAQHPGTKPTRFMTRAFESTREEVVRRFGALIGPAIEKQAARLAKRAQKRAGLL